MRVLVTGGAGFIGSHTVLLLLQQGHQVDVYDNFANSSPESLRRVAAIAGNSCRLHIGDLLDEDRLKEALRSSRPDAVVHFAGLKAVGDSVADPLSYYKINVAGTVNLLQAMQESDVKRFVFSSSATVYAESTDLPLKESAALAASSPYGRTKLHIEQMLQDLALSDDSWSIATLRYFNPVGAHPSGQIGEDPQGVPNNLMPFVAQVAVGRREFVSIYGDDYPTHDGTGVRDYIHVMDLAQGHIDALTYLSDHSGHSAWNLGTGIGSSVREVIDAFGRACGTSLPQKVVARRPGDIAEYYGDPTAARLELGWKAENGLEDMARDMWAWQSLNPTGYTRGFSESDNEEELNAYIAEGVDDLSRARAKK
ncbi:UDP-glucose 4-epimerase GalE [Glutamicibacter creatinolyticus]|uniref:UDP-glucose 4-epimerase GalE n=1 Tax=Glutamicibacter creatinolyticus TaxID=162496 RepID=UPI0032171FAE